MSCLNSCQTTWNLGSSEVKKFQEDLKTAWGFSLVSRLPAKIKTKTLSPLAQNY